MRQWTSNHKTLVVESLVAYDMRLQQFGIAAIGGTSKGDCRRGKWTAVISVETASGIKLPIHHWLVTIPGLVALYSDVPEIG